MATDRTAVLAVPAAAALLLWPALWNGYPIVFADTGTYLSQAIEHYAGWDRPIFYSLFMVPLHATVTVWPVVVAQALLTAWVLWRACRCLVPDVSQLAFVVGMAAISACTWLPWIVSELMPDVFTPLLILLLCLLAARPERLSSLEKTAMVLLAAFMIASQQSSLALACTLGVFLIPIAGRANAAPPVASPRSALHTMAWRSAMKRLQPSNANDSRQPAMVLARRPLVVRWTPLQDVPVPPCDAHVGPPGSENTLARLAKAPWGHIQRTRTRARRGWILLALPPALAMLGLCVVNLAAHGRFAVSPFGNVFLLARVIYDGPGMKVLRRDCPVENWRLCPFLDSFPATSDDFLWTHDSPLNRAGGPKAVSGDAGAIIRSALLADPWGEIRAAAANTLEQLARFDSGDGLNPWPAEVSPWIKRDFPAREQAAYAAARQQASLLAVPPPLAQLHRWTALAGVFACLAMLPVALRRRAICSLFLLAVLLALPLSAAITGGLSAPHDRYQARIMWLPPFIAVLSLAPLRRPQAS